MPPLTADSVASSGSSLEVLALLLVDALSPSVRKAAALAEAWGVSYSSNNSPVDLVVQSRRQLAGRGDPAERARLHMIDATLARAWPIAIELRAGNLQSPEIAQAVRTLAWLSRRIPSPEIHGGLFVALLHAGICLDRIDSTHSREVLRESLAGDLLPTWMQTLDHASRAQMTEALIKSCLFSPLEKFDAWVWAWRFGVDRAVDYAGALLDASAPDGMPLPLGSADDRRFLREVIAGTLVRSSDVGYKAMIESLFATLRRSSATAAWGDWLGEVFAGMPRTGWLMGLPEFRDAGMSVGDSVNGYEDDGDPAECAEVMTPTTLIQGGAAGAQR